MITTKPIANYCGVIKMIIFKRVYVVQYRVDKTNEKACATMRGRKDAHDMLIEFNRSYTGLTATDIKRID